ncbi:MAG: hypothetical protein ACJAR8_000135 [Bacteroidia bacterium]|jgi:hypothetical protein
MKKYFYLAAIVFGIVACNEEQITNTNENTTDWSEISVEGEGEIGLEGSPYRAFVQRDRDMKTCDCKFCFGICGVKIIVKVPFPNFAIKPNESPTKSKIYVLDDFSNAESEFGLDEDLVVPTNRLSGTGINSLTLISGVYNYESFVEEVIVDSVQRTSYGFVIVDKIQN